MLVKKKFEKLEIRQKYSNFQNLRVCFSILIKVVILEKVLIV